MKTKTCFALAALALNAVAAFAHVSLEAPLAATGATYRAVLRVGHGCEGSPTTALSVRLPPAFATARGLAKDGWSMDARAGAITWTASSKAAALPATDKGEFVVTGTTPRAAGALWFKVLQTCAQGSQDWADIPAQGTAITGMKTPAVLLQVMAPRELALAQALPRVENAWVRTAVAGQSGTGAFMRLTAPVEPLQLVGVVSPVAGTADVHEMKMEGDVMRMRALPRLDLPVGQPVELSPGGFHVMLQDLKQPLLKDTVVPVTLVFRNTAGAESRLELRLPVLAQAPGAAAGASSPAHKH